MAGDGLVSSDGLIFATKYPKVRKVGSSIVGVSGCMRSSEAFFDWLAASQETLGLAFPEGIDEGFEALILDENGACRSVDHKGLIMAEELPTASGSGRALAIGAMLAGASPLQAVELASQRDCYTGGRIHAVGWNKPE